MDTERSNPDLRRADGLPSRIALLALLCGCAGQAPQRTLPSSPPTRVQVAKADRSLRSLPIEVVGTVHAVKEAAIAPLVSGTVTEVRVAVGTFVQPGQILVRLTARELDARREQARAVSALATRDRDRATLLKESGAITVAQYEGALAHWGVAQAQEAEASTVADRTVLRAPFAGVITAKLVNVGEAALPGRPLLTLESRAASRLEAQVPETAANALAVGQPLAVLVDGIGRELAGRIAEIHPSADDATRSRLVKIELPATPGVRSGQFGRVLLTAGEAVTVTAPASAVVRRGQLETVFVVDSGAAHLRLVRCGRESNGLTQITSGLSGGEKLALVGSAELVDGQRVQESP